MTFSARHRFMKKHGLDYRWTMGLKDIAFYSGIPLQTIQQYYTKHDNSMTAVYKWISVHPEANKPIKKEKEPGIIIFERGYVSFNFS